MKQYRMTAQSLLQLWSAGIQYEVFAATRFMKVTRVTEETGTDLLRGPFRAIRIECDGGLLTRRPDVMMEVRQRTE